MYYWTILHETRGVIAASATDYATEAAARLAADSERMENQWTMGYGYYSEVQMRD